MVEKTLENYSLYLEDLARDTWDGSKFLGSYGATDDFKFVDYWTLRKRSLRLFRENVYAKGIIRRLLWNEIHTGLQVAPVPVGSIIWPNASEEEQEDKAAKAADDFSTQFNLYASTPSVFDWGKKLTFGAFQSQVRFESLICGDGIIISRIDQKTRLPRWQWVNGDNIRTPGDYSPKNGNFIKHGVEFDKYGRKVAFHVRSEVNGKVSYERVPTRGEKSGRLISWMVYGSETLLDNVRGEPFLADTLYMLKDLDRYRDAETRAAVINAMLAFFVERSSEAPKGSRPSDGLSRLRPAFPQNETAEPAGYEPFKSRSIVDDMRQMRPGTIFDDLDPGQKIVTPATNRPNVNYRIFEEAIISALAWTHGIPPEILMLKFGNNYSASRQANNEFEIYLSRQVKKNAETFCQNIYNGFVTQAVLTGQLDAPGFAEAYTDPTKWRTVSAWLQTAWLGLSRPSVDRKAEVTASESAVDNGFSTFDREALRNSGMTFKQVMQTQKRERELMKRMGFTPHVDEDNNGNPIPSYREGAGIDSEPVDDESALNGSGGGNSENPDNGSDGGESGANSTGNAESTENGGGE